MEDNRIDDNNITKSHTGLALDTKDRISNLARLLTIKTIYHQRTGENPEAILSKYGRDLHSHEKPFISGLVVTDEWKSIELGWIETPSIVIIINEEVIPKRRSYPEELSVIESKVIEVSFNQDPDKTPSAQWLIRPGTSMEGEPAIASKILLRSSHGTIKAKIVVFPS